MSHAAKIKLLTKRLELAAIQLDDAAGKLCDWEDLASTHACATRAMYSRNAVNKVNSPNSNQKTSA